MTGAMFFLCISMKGERQMEDKKMEDKQIVDLYWARSESAISETAVKYEKYFHYIAFGILREEEDAKECVNDTYLQAWKAMPVNKPEHLNTFLGKITRNLALNTVESKQAQKRGSGQVVLVLEELDECLPGRNHVEEEVEGKLLTEAINRFLEGIPEHSRNVFVRRYWYLSPVKEIAQEYGMGQSHVKMLLMMTRQQLKQYLEKEGML